MSKNLVLVNFIGRKSGKRFSTPTAYHRLDEKTIRVMTRSPWWKNFANGEMVQLRLQGKDYQATAEIIHDNEQVWEIISQHLKEHGDPRSVGIILGKDASETEIRQAASDLLAINFHLK